MFMRNAWYVAASETELGEELLAVKLLNESVVLYRKGDGTPVAWRMRVHTASCRCHWADAKVMTSSAAITA